MTGQNNNPILEVQDLTMDFGGIRALDKMNIRVRQGEIAALIGPNGAGKTTFFQLPDRDLQTDLRQSPADTAGARQ
ncbi:ABC transporter [Candidatus Electrothrix marina]|uniref:ABC transporter n=1 Tax=Candidatus Electrothrix marina TaxID=1859130 RepID=A0A444J6Z9_9BACT|nr:ABC transporter [Candidatus Electrothrix marina]